MKVTSDILDIIKEVKRKNARLIIVDGVNGSGKSTLAGEIAKKLGLLHINLDDYIEKNRGYFAKYIKYDLLKNEIDNTISPFIIEGVCVLNILKNLNIKHDFLIYIKRMSDYRFWQDEHLYDVDKDIDGFIANQNLEHQKFCEATANIEGNEYNPNDSTIPKLTEEIILYHYNFKPQDIADIVYERID